MKTYSVCFLILLFTAQTFAQKQLTAKQDSIVKSALTGCAYKNHYLRQSWDDCIRQGLNQDSTIAVLWQQRAMPLWKTHKYELALSYYNKAVNLDRKNYLGRRGFLKCIFQKNYREAIDDMLAAEREFGYGIQNDHSYRFYIALCHLQLNEFDKAEKILEAEFEKVAKEKGEGWIHHLDLFYMGIIQYELRKYDKAILYLDKSIAIYSKFSDAKYYKGLCLLAKQETKKAQLLMQEARSDFENGFTVNEDDSFYEPYPYQVNWHMARWTIPNQE